MMQHAVNILTAVLDQLFRSEFLCLFVLALQFLKSQSYTADAGLIRAFKD